MIRWFSSTCWTEDESEAPQMGAQRFLAHPFPLGMVMAMEDLRDHC
jgi:hypothetical protein